MLALTGLPGCYLAHLAEGQARLLWRAQPIDTVLADPASAPGLRATLARVEPARDFARQLGLTVTRQYRTYAEWPGDRVVTSVVATRPGELDPAGFFFPLVGTVPYKGFFDPARAEREAARQRARGRDVCLVPVPAYSTLGWFADPVTGPMLRAGDGFLVETVIHELVHATVFAGSAAEFNEGVATFIGQEGAVRFFAAEADAETAARERQRVVDARAVARVLADLRERVTGLYAAPDTPERAARRAVLEEEARAALAALPLAIRPAAQVAAEARLNDACLALAATYDRDLDVFAARLEALGGDLPAFIEEARHAATQQDPRAALLGVSEAR